MKTVQAMLVVGLLVGMIGCTDGNLVGLEDEETLASVEMPFTKGSSFASAKHLLPGQMETILSMPAGESLEGIALDKRGTIYVGNRRNDETGRISEILRITPDGVVSVFATLPTAAPEAIGVLGLVTDASGNVYAAHVTQDPATHGVYRINSTGSVVERLAGSEALIFPNALTFDARGTLYATDSFGGAVWRYGRGGTFTRWSQNGLLAAVPVEGAPFPIPGANGIAFFPPNTLYVANTSQFSISRIRIAPDGSAGDAEVVAQGLDLFSIDGIAVDVHENVYGVLAASNAEETGTPINPVPPLVKVNTRSGGVTAVLQDMSAFDAPTSLAFGRGRSDQQSLFIANSALFGPLTNGPGAGVVQMGVGVRGFPFQVDEPVADDDQVVFMGEWDFSWTSGAARTSCVDLLGNPLAMTIPRRINYSEGRFLYLNQTTGVSFNERCVVHNTDIFFVATAAFTFTGSQGDTVTGTETVTVMADDTIEYHARITGGTGRFEGASGWLRGEGTINFGANRGHMIVKGAVSPPEG
ncbi:MAG: SMP-30/gluconolactonase/LRE family protein [Rhodothermales bacterium]